MHSNKNDNSMVTGSVLLSIPFEFRSPIPRKFMVCAGGHFILQTMAHTNHKFPGPGVGKDRNRQYKFWELVTDCITFYHNKTSKYSPTQQ